MLDSFRDPGSTPGASSFDGRPRDWGVRYANAPLSRPSVETSSCLAPHRAPAGVDRFAHRSLRCHPPPFRGSLTVWKHARFVAVEDGLGCGVILVHRGLPFSGSARSAGSARSRRLPSASSPRCLAEPHHTAREGAVVSPLRLGLARDLAGRWTIFPTHRMLPVQGASHVGGVPVLEPDLPARSISAAKSSPRR